MPDKYMNFRELSRNETEGVDYAIHVAWRGAAVAIIAPHGGMIEPTTSGITLAIAGDDYNSYRFEGLRDRSHGNLHITSSRFDEPRCLDLVARCDRVVAVHGCVGDGTAFIEMGGADTRLRDAICTALISAGFAARLAGAKLAGTHPNNICNRGRRKLGVQLEISRPLRDALRDDAVRMARFATAVSAAIG